jgi:hypothetical protein
MPPIIWTSKWRIFRTRLAASRQTANASGRMRRAFALGDAVLEFGGLRLELGVRQRFHLRLERVDLTHGFLILLEQPLVAATENLGQ